MKRFTATEKWEKVWFQELDPAMKCLWIYVCDKCDAAGVWEPNWSLASFMIGKKVTIDSLKAFGGRVVPLKGGKVWLSSFIEFQYGKLSRDCRPHLKIFESLNKHGIDYQEGQETVVRSVTMSVSESKRKFIYARDGHKCVYCGSENELQPDHIVSRKKGGLNGVNNLVTACCSCNTIKNDKDVEEFLANNPNKQRVLEYLDRVLAKPDTLQEEDKEEEEEKDKEGDKEGQKPKARGTFDEIKTFCAAEGIAPTDAEWFFHKCEGNGWLNNGKPIKDWKATLRAWKAAAYLPSLKPGYKPPTTTFALTNAGPKGWKPPGT